ncbi:MAG: PKD domain-containing protein [Thermoplasmatota archaeon]
MKKSALALILIGLMVAVCFVNLGGADTAEDTQIDEADAPTRTTEPHNKQNPYPQWTGWNRDNWQQPWNQPWHNWSNSLQYYPQREFWFRCKNMTEDYQWLDDVNATTNGDEVGLMKEDVNTTQTEDDPMNFSYPRTDKLLTAQYDDSMNDMGILNFTINPLGLISMGTNPLKGSLKQLMVDVWIDTNGDYIFENPSANPDAAIEGHMRFDFNWWDTPYDPLDPSGTMEPYVTKAKEMQDPPVGTNRQMEEYMDGIGYWLDTDFDGKPNIPGDINGGRIWVLIWRIDNQPDDFDNRTMDLLVYCGYNQKLSWIVLPYLHPKQLPVADTGEDLGWPENKDEFKRPVSDPRHEDPIFTEANPQLKEGDIITLDGSSSFDPQDDVGADGIGYGDPLWQAADQGEGNENIDDGKYGEDPLGNLGETDSLFYKWTAETMISGIKYTIPMSTGWQKANPIYQWRINLPAMDPKLPADQQYQIVNITLTVRDTDNYQGTHTIQLLAYKSQHKPVVTISVVPQIPKEFARLNEAYILPQTEIQFNGYAYDQDPNTQLSYYWTFQGEWTTFYREGATILTEWFEEPGDWNVTLTVYDGPLDNINTLNGTRSLLLHVVENAEPVPVIRASHQANMENYFLNSMNTSKNKLVYFNGSMSYDPDIWVDEDVQRQIQEHWQGLPGFDEDLDGVPDVDMKYQWDWGDGSRTESFSSNPQSEKKWLDRGAAAKNKEYWPVKLKVWDGKTIKESEEFKVYVNLPPIAEAGPAQPGPSDPEIEVGMPVFFDGVGSYDPNDDPNYDGKRDKEYNDRLTYIWDFGDGSPTVTGKRVNHTYKVAGRFEVMLTVKDGEYSDDDTTLVNIVPANQPPVGNVDITADSWINIDNKELYTKVTLTFDATQSFDPDGEFNTDGLASTSPLSDLYNLTWNLGDGTVVKNAFTQHAYEDNGEYEVTLSMQDIKGEVWEAKYTITVINRAPIAVILENSRTVYLDEQPVMFSGEGSYDEDGTVIGYYWEFGDGTYSDKTKGIDGFQETKRTSHSYEKPGKYIVKLFVMDDDEDRTPANEYAEMTVQVRVKPDEGRTPIGEEVIFGGIIATIAILAVGTSVFAWARKRTH